MTPLTLTTPQVAAMALAAGTILGVVYTLSPLTVLCLALLIWVGWWARLGLSPREQRWFSLLLVVAVALRLAMIAGLFLSADSAHPYASFFGDEELFKNRSVWLRNIGLGLSISPADLIYVFDDTGQSSYLYLLALLQALVGSAPYGVHVLNAVLYVTGVLVLYRWVRPVYGGLVAMAGLALLLYLPSLLMWSVSALKEPVYTLAAVGQLLCAVKVARGPRWWHRVLAVAGVIVGAVVLESLRRGGWIVAAFGSSAGLAVGLTVTRPRLLVAALVATPLAGAAALATPPLRDGLLGIGRQSATYHAGHILTPGYSYQILDPRYYENRLLIRKMPAREVAAFVVRSVVSSVTEPLPWKTESLTLRAYLPEQLIWGAIITLWPIGLLVGLRRDPILTSLLMAHASALMMMVATTGGNVGTLVRHRGLVLPYIVWLSALGGAQLLRWITSTSTAPSEGTASHDDC